MTDLERVREIVVLLWTGTPEKTRLTYERHPVNDVSNIIDAHLKEDAAQVARRRALRHRAQRAEAELTELREQLRLANVDQVNAEAELANVQARLTVCNEERREQDRELARLRALETTEINRLEARCDELYAENERLREHHHQHHEGTDEW